jgi:pseudouridine kinase
VFAKRIVCFGGAHCDRRATLYEAAIAGTSNPGVVSSDLGGVARNVARNMTSLGCGVVLCSRVGTDSCGSRILSQPIDTSLVSVSDVYPTASYTAILEPSGDLVIGVADMAIYEEVTVAVLLPYLKTLQTAVLWFLDTNLPAETISWLLLQAEHIPVAVDAVSVAKARRLHTMLPRISYLFCNLAQATSIAQKPFSHPRQAAEGLRELGSRYGVVSAGPSGVAVYTPEEVSEIPALRANSVDVTGAGDALVSGTLYGVLQDLSLTSAAKLGLAAAAIAVESPHASASGLTPSALSARIEGSQMK